MHFWCIYQVGEIDIMINFEKENLSKKIPTEWQRINKEEYPIYGVYEKEGYIVYDAYKTQENILTIVSYEGVENFIEEYHAQLKQIKSLLVGKDWKTLSSVNPQFFDWIEINGVKVYLSLFFFFNSNDRVALQLFAENNFVLGFLTNIPKQSSYKTDELLKNVKILRQIISILK